MVFSPTGNRVAWLPLYNLNCKARNTPVDKTGVNFTDCGQGVLRTVDAPSLLFRLNRALESIRCCEKEPCEIQTTVLFNVDDVYDCIWIPWPHVVCCFRSSTATSDSLARCLTESHR